jgi:hypothetical protein
MVAARKGENSRKEEEDDDDASGSLFRRTRLEVEHRLATFPHVHKIFRKWEEILSALQTKNHNCINCEHQDTVFNQAALKQLRCLNVNIYEVMIRKNLVHFLVRF